MNTIPPKCEQSGKLATLKTPYKRARIKCECGAEWSIVKTDDHKKPGHVMVRLPTHTRGRNSNP